MYKITLLFSLLVLIKALFVVNVFSQESTYDSGQYFQSPLAKKARQDWVLNCQGCHKIDGTGRPEKGLPDLSGEVAKFLSVPGGREYLSRVPGVTNANINDADLTALINWFLVRFDPDNIPEDHLPYTVDEVTEWRKNPLSLDAEEQRQRLLIKIEKK